MAAIPLIAEVVRDADLDPAGYLWTNPDVREGVPADMEAEEFARLHFERFGREEGRRQLFTDRLTQVDSVRNAKLDLLRRRSPKSMESLRPTPVICAGTSITYLSVADERLPVPFDLISSHGYDDTTAQWIDSQPDALFLDVGAGLCNTYRSNVVYTEIASLPSVDILCFGDDLPFDDESFDGVVSLSVLEHVPDPFAVASEIMRVLRPDGRVIVDWPFLQPVHGYPNHYFNATAEGARFAFERVGATVRTSIPGHLHPLGTLYWFLRDWNEGLPEDQRAAFRALTVGDVLAGPDCVHLGGESWVTELDPAAESVIAAGTRLEITKGA